MLISVLVSYVLLGYTLEMCFSQCECLAEFYPRGEFRPEE